MIKRLARCIREYKLPAILGPVCMIGEVAMEVLIPLVMAKLYDWGKDRLPPVSSESAAAARWVGTVYLVLIIALCWIVLLATQEMTEFAYFQF